jgi:hypothetical protein
MARSAIETLTPHMAAYSNEFSDSGNVNWLPYTMYFHPFNFHSEVVSTDSAGFRYSEARGLRYSAATLVQGKGIRLLVGSSTVFGIGASADRHTLASRLTERDERPEFWVNFGGRSFNSTQELILFLLHQHRLPPISEVVLFSGFNDLGLAHLPEGASMEGGAFFMCREFTEAMERKRSSVFSNLFRREQVSGSSEISMDQQLELACNLTLRHLDSWRSFSRDKGFRLTFVLQPLANWVRSPAAPEEERLFAELELRGAFSESYGDVLSLKTHKAYANRLKMGAEKIGVNFIDFADVLAKRIRNDEWIFVDRIHFTDIGHDIAANALLKELLKGDKS